jgi:predicted MPP superfamily phosphohydrolase
MKILAIGDIHGRDVWKDANFAAYDKVVFIGDYVDSFDKSDTEIFNNLKTIIDKKIENAEKFVLLLGNHDIHYIQFPQYRCSGFRPEAQFDLTELFHENRQYFQIAYQIKNYLFTHAGVSNSWYKHNFKYFKKKKDTLADTLNEMYMTKEGRDTLFQCSQLRGGIDKSSGIVWADKRETKDDFLYGYHQIVGHTRVPDFDTVNLDGLDSSITYIDVLEFKTKFYELHIKTS